MSAYDLSWIKFDTLTEIAAKRFRKAFNAAETVSNRQLAVEPTLPIARAFLTASQLEEYRSIDESVAVTKTIQNAIGLFHQDVLSSVTGWQTMGTSGGVIDFHSTGPVKLAGNRKVFVEIKMRYNTIKASDQAKLHSELQTVVKSHGAPRKTVAYLIQVVPEKPEPYNKEWKVSGRTPLEYVRVVDGVTGYHLVTGVPDALHQLLRVFPFVMEAVMQELKGFYTPNLARHIVGDGTLIEELIRNSLPAKSAL